MIASSEQKTFFKHQKGLTLFIFFLLLGIIAFSFVRSRKVSVEEDFYAFYMGGEKLLSQLPLYKRVGPENDFIYPPASAIIFAPFSLFPYPVATFFWFLINFFTWFAAFFLIYKIYQLYIKDPKKLALGVGLSFLFSFKFFWNNIIMMQANGLLLVFTLLGILAFLKKRENWAIFWFCLAVSYKVTPIFFFFWVLLRGSNKAFFKALFWAVFMALPFLFSGWERGLADLHDYWNNFILRFAGGHVRIAFADQSLGAWLHRIFTSAMEQGHTYTWIDLGIEKAKLIHKISFIFIFISFLAGLWVSKKKFKAPNPLEPALVFLVSHLLSGITWKYHLISFGFIFMALFYVQYNFKLDKHTNRLKYLAFSLVGILSLSGRSIIGPMAQRYVGGWGFFTMLMLILMAFFIISLRGKSLKRSL